LALTFVFGRTRGLTNGRGRMIGIEAGRETGFTVTAAVFPEGFNEAFTACFRIMALTALFTAFLPAVGFGAAFAAFRRATGFATFFALARTMSLRTFDFAFFFDFVFVAITQPIFSKIAC